MEEAPAGPTGVSLQIAQNGEDECEGHATLPDEFLVFRTARRTSRAGLGQFEYKYHEALVLLLARSA